MIWAAVSIGLMGFVYKYRRLRVFKVASPTFLCATLLGCAIMYAEASGSPLTSRSLLTRLLCADGGHLPGAEHAGVRGHQVDAPHGLHRHVQLAAHEDVEVSSRSPRVKAV